MAAARPDTPLTDLVAELDGEEHRGEWGGGGGVPRAGVAGVFSWPWGHLPADAARMFRLLGLHPAEDWDRYAAAALAGVGLPQAGRLLGLLARAHLIQPASARRLCLHDHRRAYAARLHPDHHSAEPPRSPPPRLVPTPP